MQRDRIVQKVINLKFTLLQNKFTFKLLLDLNFFSHELKVKESDHPCSESPMLELM